MTAKVLYLSELSSAGDWQDFTGSVVCFGHFNAIHPGHIRYFLKARQYGSPLVVALEGDAPRRHQRIGFGEVGHHTTTG